MRVFPLSNWTELDVWEYVQAEDIPVVPLYFAKVRPGGRALRRADHGRRRAAAARARRDAPQSRVRFRTLGCYPLTGAIESDAETLDDIIAEMRAVDHLRAAGPPDRLRRSRLDGEEEAGGLFLMNEALRAIRASDPAPAHLRLGRRRQVDPDRPPAVREEADFRRSALGARARLEEVRHDRGRHRLRAAGRRARSRARAGHHDRRRLPLFRDRRRARSSWPTRPATSSIPATWRPAPPTPISPSCSSMRARACSPRPIATRSSRRCSASATSCWR